MEETEPLDVAGDRDLLAFVAANWADETQDQDDTHKPPNTHDKSLDVDNEATFANADAGALTLTDTVLACDKSFKVETDDSGNPEESFDIESWFDGQTGNFATDDAGLDGFLPATGSSLIGAGTGGGTVGAFDAGEDWASAWIISESN